MKNYIWFVLAFILLVACKKENARVNECSLEGLIITPLECTSDTTYTVKIDFEHNGIEHQSFDVFIRNDESIGSYSIDSLPIILKNFKISGKNYDLIKICINDRPECCLVEEFLPPNCSAKDYEIDGITTQLGECTSDSTYRLTIDFDDSHLPPNADFNLYARNNKFIGKYSVKSLPIVISKFQISGKTEDFIKICIEGYPALCKEFEFLPPNCSAKDYEIKGITTQLGECTSDSTYRLTIDFDDSHLPPNADFNLYARNNKFIGKYSVKSLPIVISKFQISGKTEDFIKICIEGYPELCEEFEFLPPKCLSEMCSIKSLVVEQGACTSDSTYALTINFKPLNPTQSSFDVYIRNGVLIGYYKFSDLPLTIKNFKESGKDYDYIKVCINDNPDCCEALEFLTKDCK
jgi:hypothetical protein